MSYPLATFEKFIVKTKKSTLFIRAEPKRRLDEKIGAFGIFLLPLLILRLFLPMPDSEWSILVALVAAFILFMKFRIYILGVNVVKIDKQKKLLTEFSLDKFQAELSDIKELSIVEQAYVGGNEEEIKLYRLQYVLHDGERTSGFAFTSFNKAEEVLKIIKSASGEK